jgi:hypothetical protein
MHWRGHPAEKILTRAKQAVHKRVRKLLPKQPFPTLDTDSIDKLIIWCDIAIEKLPTAL